MRNQPDIAPFESALPSGIQQSMTAPRHGRRMLLLGLLVFMLVSLALPGTALAACWFTSGSATNVNTTFNLTTVTLTPSTPIGTTVAISNLTSPANPPQLNCNGDTNGGIVNTIAGQTPVNGDNTLIPTGIPGISYRLLHPDANTKLALYPNYRTGSGDFSVKTKLQLVYTGPYLPPNNATLTGQLSQWKIDICDHSYCRYYVGLFPFGHYEYEKPVPRPVEIFNINVTILIQVPTCDIAPHSKNKVVPLPTINTAQLNGQSSTVGQTPFKLQLINCPNNLHVFITLDSNNPQPGATGVIAPTAGYASGVGVQILKADGNTPVTFGNAINTGTTSASSYAINLYARYYQTGTNITAGNVKAMATYTLNYN